MKIIYNSRLFKLPLLRNYSAIVLGRRCYVKEARASTTLIRHEEIHQEQMDRHGILPFYLLYLGHYFWNLLRYRDHDKAYRMIPFEQEAYAREHERERKKET